MDSRLSSRIALVIGLGFAVAFLSQVGTERSWLQVAIKAVPCTLMALMVVAARPGRSGRLIAAGLALSVVGDVLLEIPADLFVPGLIAFLTAHLVYIGAFALRWRGGALPGLLVFALWGGGAFAFLLPKPGALTLPVGVYCLVITAMGWRASAGVGEGDADARRTAVIALLGATLFMFSDTVLAINKFHTPFTGARYLNMTTYWGGQLLLCVAARRM